LNEALSEPASRLKAKRYAEAARAARLRGEHRRAAQLYMVASTLLEAELAPNAPPCLHRKAT
jgi:hypothetical protein